MRCHSPIYSSTLIILGAQLKNIFVKSLGRFCTPYNITNIKGAIIELHCAPHLLDWPDSRFSAYCSCTRSDSHPF